MGTPLGSSLMYDDLPVETKHTTERERLQGAEDMALVNWARAGEQPAFDELVRRYRNEVYALSYHFVHHRETAWDIAQEAFIKAYRSLNRFRGDAAFKTWLMRITANQCKDYLKKRRIPAAAFDDAIQTEAPSAAPFPRRRP